VWAADRDGETDRKAEGDGELPLEEDSEGEWWWPLSSLLLLCSLLLRLRWARLSRLRLWCLSRRLPRVSSGERDLLLPRADLPLYSGDRLEYGDSGLEDCDRSRWTSARTLILRDLKPEEKIDVKIIVRNGQFNNYRIVRGLIGGSKRTYTVY